MSALDQLYQQIILGHSKARYGSDLTGAAVPSGARCGQSHQVNPSCGDEITLRVAVSGGTVQQIRWDGTGCVISMAAASALTELGEGMDVAELQSVIDSFRGVMRSRGQLAADEEILGDAAAFAGVSRYVARVKCAMLAWVAAEQALTEVS